MGPSFFSSGGGGTCQRSAPSCGISSQSGTSTPSLLLALASAAEIIRNWTKIYFRETLFCQEYMFLFCIELCVFFPLTSTAAVWSDIFFLGLISLFLRWTWYIFSAATHDLGLSSGGMVMPYSQPVIKGDEEPYTLGYICRIKKWKKRCVYVFKVNFTLFIHSPVAVKTPVIFPDPSRWTVKLSWTLSLFSILYNIVWVGWNVNILHFLIFTFVTLTVSY